MRREAAAELLGEERRRLVKKKGGGGLIFNFHHAGATYPPATINLVRSNLISPFTLEKALLLLSTTIHFHALTTAST